MIDYKIISWYSTWSIEKQMKKYFTKWYKPQGGIFKAWGRYFQAIIKIDESIKL